MRAFLLALAFFSGIVHGQIPESGVFHYELFDTRDRKVGQYQFTIAKDGRLWRITSTMDVDTEVFFLKVRLRDHNSFTHDGVGFQSFEMEYFKDVPFQTTLRQTTKAQRQADIWSITQERNGNKVQRRLENKDFDEVRNLVSRLIRPEAILRAGESRSARSLDPLTLDIGTVQSRGLGTETISFQGKMQTLHIMEQKAPDGDVTVKKFDNGLIYHSQTAEGYALLKSAQ